MTKTITPSKMTLDELRAETESNCCVHCGLGLDLDHTGCGKKPPSHTPGPWAADDGDGQYWGVFADNDSDAICYLCDWSPLKRETPLRREDAANARLIAAAPEMLMALKAAIIMVEKALPKFNWADSALDAQAIRLLNEVPVEVRLAIHRAEGK